MQLRAAISFLEPLGRPQNGVFSTLAKYLFFSDSSDFFVLLHKKWELFFGSVPKGFAFGTFAHAADESVAISFLSLWECPKMGFFP